MNGNYPMFLDAELVRRTKVSHIVIFVLGTLLMPCGLVVAYLGLLYMQMSGLRGFGGEALANPVYCAIAGTGSGVFAWVMLGLLFFKRADPRWHVVVWPSLILFSLVAGFGCFVWLTEENMADVGWISAVLWTVVLASVLCLVIGIRNLGLAVKSRRKLKAELEAFLIRYEPPTQINPPN
ncbi:MAG: hypothetical protein CFE26_27155 [Verrucomicrobiales bacterium VVV1]|nr:MAG: hypothetical protein CFE26_27155 [Verrucomicrobiales bacterium VVV1]